jgi:hypothetical protein
MMVVERWSGRVVLAGLQSCVQHNIDLYAASLSQLLIHLRVLRIVLRIIASSLPGRCSHPTAYRVDVCLSKVGDIDSIR